MDVSYIKRIGVYVLLAITSLALIASLVYHAFEDLSDDLELTFLKSVKVSEDTAMEAFMCVDEHSIKQSSSHESDAIIEYASGKVSYVSIGDTVVRAYPSTGDASALERVYALRAKIAFCKKVDEYSSRQSAEQLKQKMEKTEKDIASAGTLDAENKLREEYRALLAAYSAKMDSSVNYQKLIKDCESEINAAISSLGKVKNEYKSDVNGAYFSECDGYEGMIDISSLSSADLDTLYTALNEKNKDDSVHALGKVVDMNVWYLVCRTDRETSLRVVKGNTLNVTLESSGKVCKMTVDRVVSERDRDEAVIILKSSLMLECDDYAHFQTVKVALGSSEGYKIPTGAVRYENGVSGVYVLRGSIVRFRQIEIVGAFDGYVIVSPTVSEVGEGLTALNRYDRVIVRGHNLYDKKVII